MHINTQQAECVIYCMYRFNPLLLLDVSSPTWSGHRKHVFVLSKAGKPVYARYGCEDKLVGLFGIMQALISIVEDGNDVLR